MIKSLSINLVLSRNSKKQNILFPKKDFDIQVTGMMEVLRNSQLESKLVPPHVCAPLFSA